MAFRRRADPFVKQDYDLSYEAEPTAQRFHASNAFVKGIRGPWGSGKSVSCVMEMVMRGMEQAPDKYGRRRTRWAAIRNTFGMLRTTTMKTWMDWVPEHIAKVNRGEPMSAMMELALPDDTVMEMEVWFISCDKPNDVAKLKSLELTGVWLNEASELDKIILDMASARVGRYPAKKDGAPFTWAGVIMDTNSMDDDHWWYALAEGVDDPEEQEAIDLLKKNIRDALLSIGMDRPLFEFYDQPAALLEMKNSDGSDGVHYVPNPDAENVIHQPQGFAYWLLLIVNKTRQWVDIYIRNQYGKVIDGLPVYAEYKDEVHGRKLKLSAIPGKPITVGIDFGLSPAIACIQWHNGRINVLGELCAVERSMGMRRFINDAVKPYLVERFGVADPNGDPWKYEFIGDPAGDARAQSDETTGYTEVRNAQFDIVAAPTNNFGARRDAVAWYLTKLDGLAMDASCVTLRKGFRGGYHYRRIQVSGEARYQLEAYGNKFTHPHDCLQYAILPYAAIEVPAAGMNARPQWEREAKIKGAASANRPWMRRGGRVEGRRGYR